MFKIEVYTKKEFNTTYAQQILSDINQVIQSQITKINCSFIYTIEGDIDKRQIDIICSKLLTDPITEEYCYQNIKQYIFNTKWIIIEVWYKNGVTDTVAETVVKAVKDLGITNKIRVKRGYKYYLYSPNKKIQDYTLHVMSRVCLCNVLIQDYIIKKYQ
ncbi:MAG: phosphoribosylformylglycinamidine synthase subunit PurS [Endomicrobium sp.]|jgi:phosphoribosylformylglycinamidine synthase|nr:phosphoribosylformylglycinamidine synthase subunit PurS [Endomicrobium sp.]